VPAICLHIRRHIAASLPQQRDQQISATHEISVLVHRSVAVRVILTKPIAILVAQDLLSTPGLNFANPVPVLVAQDLAAFHHMALQLVRLAGGGLAWPRRQAVTPWYADAAKLAGGTTVSVSAPVRWPFGAITRNFSAADSERWNPTWAILPASPAGHTMPSYRAGPPAGNQMSHESYRKRAGTILALATLEVR